MTDQNEAPAPVVEFVEPAKRFATYELKYPFSYNGTLVDKVVVRRMTTREVTDYLAALGRGETPDLPLVSVSQAVIDEMDPDDSDDLLQVVQDFLPRRFRELAASTPGTGDLSSSSSSDTPEEQVSTTG